MIYAKTEPSAVEIMGELLDVIVDSKQFFSSDAVEPLRLREFVGSVGYHLTWPSCIWDKIALIDE